MKIKKGSKLKIQHLRLGIFYGIAIKTFDTEQETFYPIELDQLMLWGLSTEWVKGDYVPCRNSLCNITILEEPKGSDD